MPDFLALGSVVRSPILREHVAITQIAPGMKSRGRAEIGATIKILPAPLRRDAKTARGVQASIPMLLGHARIMAASKATGDSGALHQWSKKEWMKTGCEKFACQLTAAN